MFEPRYTITPRLLANIKRIAELTTLLNARSFPKVVLMEFVKRANSLSAYASTSIEGNPLPITDVKQIIKSHPNNVRDSEREVLNYNDALVYLNDRIDHGRISLDKKFVLSIHKMIMEGLISKGRLGKLRVEPVFVNDPQTGKTVYWPPDVKDVSPLTDDLVGFIKKQHGKLDPLIIAGIFHKQFVIVHPFMDGNKRVGHAAMETFLFLNGMEISAGVDDQEKIMIKLASGQETYDEFVLWLNQNTISVSL